MAISMSTCEQVVIVAGGMGTRLAAATGGLPKALVPVAGQSVLERQLALARDYGVLRALLLLGHGSDQIVESLRRRPVEGMSVDWAVESEPLGNGGALLQALDRLEHTFLVFFADQLMALDIRRLIAQHVTNGNAATVVVHPNDHPHDSDLLEVDAAGRVTALHHPPHVSERPLRNVVNAATYVLDRATLEVVNTQVPPRLDLARDLLPRMIAAGLRVGAYRSREYLKDMGTPERLAKVERDLESGIVDRRLAMNPMPAILLDRDGTMNVEVGRITQPSDLVLVTGIGDAVNRAHAAGYLVGVVTNQPIIARGDVTMADLDAIHGRMEMLLAESRAFVDGIYVCPHHPDKGFPGEIAHLKGPCKCRKPATGLVDQAVAELGLDRSLSWLIGDTTTDVQCAIAAGLFPVLVDTGHGGRDARFSADAALRFTDAPAAIDFIVNRFPDLWQSCLTVAAHLTTGDRVVIRAMDDVQAANCRRLVVEAFRRQGLSVCPFQPRHASEVSWGPAVDVVADIDETFVSPDLQIVRLV